MRYLPRSPLLPSPTRTSPPFFAQLGTVLSSCSALPLSTADSHSCCPCLADGLPQPALLLLLLPNCYQSLSLFFFLYSYHLLPAPFSANGLPQSATCYRPLFTAPLCRRTAPISSSYYSYSALLPPFLALHSLRLLSHTPAAAAGG